MLVAPGPRVDMQMPGLPVMSPQVEASMAPATSCFISRNRIWRWRAASISSTDSPPGCPTMNGVPASLNAAASTSTVVVIVVGSLGDVAQHTMRGAASGLGCAQTRSWLYRLCQVAHFLHEELCDWTDGPVSQRDDAYGL